MSYGYLFNQEHELFRQGLRDFLQREVIPFIDEWEEKGRVPKELWKKFGEMGYLGLNYPESYGGMNADFYFSVVFLEEIARCFSGGFTIIPSVQQFMASPYLFKFGSEILKDQYLRRAISGEWICAIAITEPGAGSDVANIQCRAEKKGDFYLVNGSKTFITNGVYGDFLITAVKTNPEKGLNGISLLVIDRQSPGVSARKLKKLGWHASDTAELHFDGVQVPVENLVGEEDQGFFYLMAGLQLERLAGAISALSGSQHALEYTLQYMSERQAFGRPINKFQVLRHHIAQLASEIEATRAFVYHCCRMHAEGQYAVKESSMAKLLATELSDKVMYQCLQMFGGYGYMEEYRIARMFRDSRIGTIGGGTSEIMREIIAKMVIDEKNYSKGQSLQGLPSSSASFDPGSPRSTTKGNAASEPGGGWNQILENIRERSAQVKPLGATLKFDFGMQQLFLDGTGAENRVSTENKPADCTVQIDLEDFMALIRGELDPVSALLSGKFQIQGDMAVAMKLQSLFGR